MSDVKWIKLDVDMFSNPKIKRLRRLPEGNNVLLIWVMLLTMAGRCNAGGMIFITQNVLYTAEDLADELGFSVDTVKLALSALENLGMITLENDSLEITDWCNHQSIDGMEKVREQNRVRKQRQRERQIALLDEKSMSRDSHVNVTHSSYSNSISNSNSNSSSLSKDNKYKDTISNIINYLNNKLGTKYKANSKVAVKHITARLNEGYLEEDFYVVIDKKYDSWHRDTKMAQYLTPETLFGTKFEKYYNEPAAVKKTELDGWAEVLNGSTDWS